MAHQVIFPKNEGTKQGSLPAIVQGSTLETITILALYKDGSNVDLSTMAVTATMTDRDNSTTDVTGTLTGANGSFTWAYSAGDIGTAGRFSTIITYTDGVDSWSSEPVDFDVIANPAATAVQNPALVGIPTSDAAWVSVSADGGALGTAAYIDDAPSDGNQYARQDAAWVEVDVAGLAVLEAALIPVAVADMTATADGNAAVDLAWTYTAVAPITGFKIYRKTGLGSYALIDTAADDATSYADSGLDSSTEYDYRVDAYNAYFQTAGNEDSATTGDVALADLIMALPGFVGLWKLDDTSGTTVVEAGGTTALDGTYAGSIPLAAVALPTAVGGSVANFQDLDDDIQFTTAAIQAAWSWQTGWFGILFKQAATGENKLFTRIGSGGTIKLETQAHSEAGAVGYLRITNPSRTISYYQRHNDWTLLLLSWDTAGNEIAGYFQGAELNTTTYTGAGTVMGGDMIIGRMASFRGGLAYACCGAGDVPTDAQIDALYKAIYPTTNKAVLAIGDSWATNNDYWVDQLVADLRTNDGNAWREAPYRIGYSGDTVATINTELATDLPAALITQPDLVVLVCAANDITNDTAETPFKSDFGGILDTIITNCPGVPIVANFPYRDDAYDGALDAKALTIKTWMQEVIATKSGNTIYAIDGNIWFKTSIDTWSSDRIHPTTEAGFAELAGEIMTAAGYI